LTITTRRFADDVEITLRGYFELPARGGLSPVSGAGFVSKSGEESNHENYNLEAHTRLSVPTRLHWFD
jgi:hypothetical protein